MSNEHITDERATFEAWFLEKQGITAKHHQQGGYTLNAANMMWAAWQASRAALRPAAQPAEQWETSPKDGEQWETSPMAAAQLVVEPFGWWFTEDPDVFCMPGSGFRRFPDKPQHTVECIALYTTPQPVAVPGRVPMTDEQLCEALSIDGADHWTYEVRDAVERFHGITTPKADK